MQVHHFTSKFTRPGIVYKCNFASLREHYATEQQQQLN